VSQCNTALGKKQQDEANAKKINCLHRPLMYAVWWFRVT